MSTKITQELVNQKVQEYIYSNPNQEVTKKTVNEAIKLTHLRLQRKEFAKKGDKENFNEVTEKLQKIADNNQQANFLAIMFLKELK